MPCVLRIGAKRHDARVLDLSRTGLSIRSEVELSQGDEVELSLEPSIEIQAIAWRTMRTKSGYVTGMMLSNESAAYDALVERHASRPRPAASATAPSAPKAAPPGVRMPDPWWRVRVKERNSNRMRVVALPAPTRSAAIARTFAEIGSSWEVLEAELALRPPPKPS